MNYINRLQQENTELQAQLRAARDELQELLAYVNSPKFNCGDSLDGYVSCGDIATRIQTAQINITQAGK